MGEEFFVMHLLFIIAIEDFAVVVVVNWVKNKNKKWFYFSETGKN